MTGETKQYAVGFDIVESGRVTVEAESVEDAADTVASMDAADLSPSVENTTIVAKGVSESDGNAQI